jgi:hypothetical protein
MIVAAGVLLVVLAALFVAGFVLAPGGTTEAEFYGLILPNLSARTLVVLGLALGLVIAFGLSLVQSRVTRWSQRRKARAATTADPDATQELDSSSRDVYSQPSPEH